MTGLTPEQQRLTQRTYDSFVRQGARLERRRKQQLSKHQPGTRHRVLGLRHQGARRGGHVDRDRQRGRPGGSAAGARLGLQGLRQERKIPGKWAVENTRSSVDPFLTFRRAATCAQRVWTTFKSRGDNGDANDTNAVIARIVKLRADRARLLGFATHAHWRMDDTMARDPQKAIELMLRVWAPAVARVKEEVADMQAIASSEGQAITIEPWDYLYYAEKVRKAKYDLDTNELKPYFELNNVIAASYEMAEKPVRTDLHRDHRHHARLPSGRPGLRGEGQASGRHVGVYLPRRLRAPVQAIGRVGRRAIAASAASTARSRQSRPTTTTSSRARPVSPCSSAWTMQGRCSTSSGTRCTGC